MNAQTNFSMWGSSILDARPVAADFMRARVRRHVRGKRETLAMRVALAVGGPRLARPRTLGQVTRDLRISARRLAGPAAAAAAIVAIETTLSVLSR